MNQLPTDSLLIKRSKSADRSVNKTCLSYWESAIYQRRPGGNWQMILQHAGTRRALSLETPLKAAAAARARDTYLAVLAGGWEAAGKEKSTLKTTGATVGDFLSELASKADLKPETLEGYAIAFRSIVAGICGIDGGREKFDHKGGGHAKWIKRIHAVRLEQITPAKVQEWKRSFLAAAGKDPVTLRSAKTSLNSYLRRAKSLFAPGAIKHLSIQLPSPLPFDGIAFEPRQSMRYRSNIGAVELCRAAQTELAEQDPNVFLAFLLALGAGLRRGEIDRLQWSAFRWNDNVIRIEATRYFEPKTEHSSGDVQIDPELMSVFRGYAALAGSNFVIEGPEADGYWNQYRAKEVFERLSAWLRKHGVTARKPIHELRKEFGSMVNREHGLSAASDQLRHADIGITAACYIDRPRKATSGLGPLLSGKVLEFKREAGVEHPPDEFPGLKFRFASTMKAIPHFYVVRTPENEAEYVRLFHLIEEQGVWETWEKDGRRYRYLYREGWKYWAMSPHDLAQSKVINRA